MHAGPTWDHRPDAPPKWLYAAFALAGIVAGLLLAQAGACSRGGSRIQWPEPARPHPRSLNS